MYVAKIKRYGMYLHATVFDKAWSEDMMTNQISLVEQKKFLFRSSACRWIRNAVIREMIKQHELEIVDG